MWLLTIAIALFCYIYSLSYKDVVILIRAQQVDLEVLHLLDHTEVAYKAISNAYDHSKNESQTKDWNHAIFAREFYSDASLNKYISLVRNLNFVEEVTEVTVLTSNYKLALRGYNFVMKIWRVIGGKLEFIPSGPYARSAQLSNECNQTRLEGDAEIHTISLLRVRNQTALALYSDFFVWKAVPAFSIETVYNGRPESETWSLFSIFKFKDFKNYCELTESEFFNSHLEHRREALEESYAKIVTPLL